MKKMNSSVRMGMDMLPGLGLNAWFGGGGVFVSGTHFLDGNGWYHFHTHNMNLDPVECLG